MGEAVRHIIYEIKRGQPTARCGVDLPPRVMDSKKYHDLTLWNSEATCEACLQLSAPRKELMETEPEIDKLWDAIDRLWGWMGSGEVIAINEDDPELAELCRYAHQRMSHN